MLGMLGFMLLFVGFLGSVVVAKMIVTTVGMALYRIGFAIYYFVKNENVDYKALVLKGEMTRPTKKIIHVNFSQGTNIKKSA